MQTGAKGTCTAAQAAPAKLATLYKGSPHHFQFRTSGRTLLPAQEKIKRYTIKNIKRCQVSSILYLRHPKLSWTILINLKHLETVKCSEVLVPRQSTSLRHRPLFQPVQTAWLKIPGQRHRRRTWRIRFGIQYSNIFKPLWDSKYSQIFQIFQALTRTKD